MPDNTNTTAQLYIIPNLHLINLSLRDGALRDINFKDWMNTVVKWPYDEFMDWTHQEENKETLKEFPFLNNLLKQDLL